MVYYYFVNEDSSISHIMEHGTLLQWTRGKWNVTIKIKGFSLLSRLSSVVTCRKLDLGTNLELLSLITDTN